MENTVFFVGARANSKGLKNKNLLKINNKSLFEITIIQAMQSKFKCKIIVSSNSKSILDIAKKYNIDFIIKRPKNLSTDTASKFDVWKHAIFKYEKTLGKNIDIFFELDCTNPLRRISDVDKILELKLKSPKVDGIVTSCISKKNPYFNMVEEDRNRFLKISKKLKIWPSSRQKAPKVLELIANIYCFNAKFIKNNFKIFDGKIQSYLLPRYQAFDIDDQTDFNFVKKIFNEYKF